MSSQLRIDPLTGQVGYRLSGELDMATAGELTQALEEALSRGGTRILLELSELEFMDSSGLRVILEAAKRVGADRPIVLVGAGGAVRRLLQVSGVEGRIPGLLVEPDE